jgi:hypothetical protein
MGSLKTTLLPGMLLASLISVTADEAAGRTPTDTRWIDQLDTIRSQLDALARLAPPAEISQMRRLGLNLVQWNNWRNVWRNF